MTARPYAIGFADLDREVSIDLAVVAVWARASPVARGVPGGRKGCRPGS